MLERVIASFGFEALCENPKTGVRQTLKHRRSMRPVCGDLVHVKDDIISEILPRKNVVERIKSNKAKPPIAANIDMLGIVVSHEPLTPWFFIDAWLLIAWVQNIKPILIKNKSDISSFASFEQKFNNRFDRCGYAEWTGSAINGENIDALLHGFRDKIVLLVGLSGVGKSSLTNALIPNAQVRTQSLSLYSSDGKHTTTNSVLHHFEDDLQGGLIDSPGIKEIDLVMPDNMEEAWPEFEPFLGKCQFRNCQHGKELGCAILAGVKEGLIHENRYQSFCHLKKTLGLKNFWE